MVVLQSEARSAISCEKFLLVKTNTYMKSDTRQSQLNLNLPKLKFMTNALLLLLTAKILL